MIIFFYYSFIFFNDEVETRSKTDSDVKAKQEAFDMLKSLSGHVHSVVTGVSITTAYQQITFSADTQVEFAPIEDDEIKWYVDHFSPLDKAGAYGIQEWIGCIGIRNINGSYYNVMGLPLHRLYCELKKF